MIAIEKQGLQHRLTVMQSMFDSKEAGLEIGPSFRPVAPKSKGYNVKSVDHASTADLLEKYKDRPASAVASIEEVDFVWQGGSLVDLIGPDEKFGYVIASHVIEHTTDIVRFLRDCEALLKPDGKLVLAVPDKRYCYDYFRPISTTGDAIEAYMQKRDRHTISTIFDHYSLLVRNHGIGAWSKDKPSSGLKFIFRVKNGMEKVDEALATSEYTDVHGWQFTPSSFRLLLSDLRTLGLTQLVETRMVDGNDCEFFVTLQKGPKEPMSRVELAKAFMREQAEAIAGIDAPKPAPPGPIHVLAGRAKGVIRRAIAPLRGR